MHRKRLSGLLLALTLLGCTGIHSLTTSQKAERLATERGRLSELTDPLERVHSYITMSDILLDFAVGFEHDGNLDATNGLLLQYVRAIQDASDTLVKLDRDAGRNLAGVKDLEFALARQIRRLQDLASNLPSADRQPIDRALATATSVHERTLKPLSPQGTIGVSRLFVAVSYAAPRAQSSRNKAMEALDKEREKLKHETDPVDRTQSDIKISGALLTLVNTAVAEGNMGAMRDLLKEYSATIEDASHSMMSSGKDANKHSSGFKELEIALRGQIRRLEDVAGGLTMDQRAPVEKVRQRATEIREELVKALFGGPKDK